MVRAHDNRSNHIGGGATRHKEDATPCKGVGGIGPSPAGTGDPVKLKSADSADRVAPKDTAGLGNKGPAPSSLSEQELAKKREELKKRCEEEGVDVPDTPPDPPIWENPSCIEPLIQIGDGREYDLIKHFLRLDALITHYSIEARVCSDPTSARIAFVDATRLFHAFLKTALTLNAYRVTGTQQTHVLRVKGPTVGLGAKVQALRSPSPGSPQAEFVERVEELEWRFNTFADHCVRKAEGARPYIEDLRYACMNNIAVITRKDESLWIELSTKAYELANKISAVVNQLKRGRDQVMILEETDVRGDAVEPPREGPDDIPQKYNLQ